MRMVVLGTAHESVVQKTHTHTGMNNNKRGERGMECVMSTHEIYTSFIIYHVHKSSCCVPSGMARVEAPITARESCELVTIDKIK